jgi:hypothetical protein
VANPTPSSPRTAVEVTRRQGAGAGTTGAARSRSRMARWYSESSGARADCSPWSTFSVRFGMPAMILDRAAPTNAVVVAHRRTVREGRSLRYSGRTGQRAPGVLTTRSPTPSDR